MVFHFSYLIVQSGWGASHKNRCRSDLHSTLVLDSHSMPTQSERCWITCNRQHDARLSSDLLNDRRLGVVWNAVQGKQKIRQMLVPSFINRATNFQSVNLNWTCMNKRKQFQTPFGWNCGAELAHLSIAQVHAIPITHENWQRPTKIFLAIMH